MSIIHCVECNKRISDKAPVCPHCGCEFSGELDEESAKEIRRRQLRDKRYRLRMISYACLSVFTIGFIWFWLQSQGLKVPAGRASTAVIAVGAVGYAITRVLMILNVRQARKQAE